MKTCPICKESKEETEFYKNNVRVDNLSCWCKACVKARYPKKYHRDRLYTVEARFRSMLNTAKSREIPVTLTLEEYRVLTQEGQAPCFYCEAPIVQLGSGLDRLDYTKGYELDNVVPCCKFCNTLKSMLEKQHKGVAKLATIAKKMRAAVPQSVENTEGVSEEI